MTPVTPNRKLKVFVAHIRIWRSGNTVKMRVIKQGPLPQAWRATLKTLTDMTVLSIDRPELEHNRIYLRGQWSHRDNDTASLSFDGEADAEEYLQKCKKALSALYI